MTVYAITDTKKGEQGLCLLIFKLPKISPFASIYLLTSKMCCNNAYFISWTQEYNTTFFANRPVSL